MPKFSFDKKKWEKHRPSSAKASGVAKAIKDVESSCPSQVSSIRDERGFQAALDALNALQEAFATATGKLKPKDDSTGILELIGTWNTEINDYRRDLQQAFDEWKLNLCSAEAERLYEEMLVQMNVSIEQCKKQIKQVEKDVAAGKEIDAKRLAVDLQSYRTQVRDAAKFCTKNGKVDKLKFNDLVRKYAVNPADIPLPATAKHVKARMDLLEESADQLSDLVDQAYDRTPIPDGQFTRQAKSLIAAYKRVRTTHKSQATQAKKILDAATKVASICKDGKMGDTSKLLVTLQKVAESFLKLDEQSLGLQYETRDGSGKIQTAYSSLVNQQGFPEDLNDRLRDQRASVFDAYRTVSITLGKAQNQLGRCFKHLIASEGATAQQAASLEKDFERRYGDTSRRYHRA